MNTLSPQRSQSTLSCERAISRQPAANDAVEAHAEMSSSSSRSDGGSGAIVFSVIGLGRGG